MDDREALHTAARRYCMERAPELWRALEAEIAQERHLKATGMFQGPQASSGVGTRWDVVRGILRRVEAVDPATFPSLDALCAFLFQTAEEASLHEDTRPIREEAGQGVGAHPLCEEEQRAGTAERARFRTYVETMASENLRDIDPLPYRRLLTEAEAERLWRRLVRKWQIPYEGYWWPMRDEEAPPPHVLAFDDWEFDKHISVSLITNWLRGARARRVVRLELIFLGEDYEMDLDFFDLDSFECYWTSSKMDWVIYRSHEGSTTIGGEWMLNLVKRAWPEWANHLRTTHIPPGPE